MKGFILLILSAIGFYSIGQKVTIDPVIYRVLFKYKMIKQ